MDRPNVRNRWLASLVAVTATLWLAGCGADSGQARLCAAAVGAFEDRPERVEILGSEPAPGRPHAVTVRWRAGGGERWIACAFAGGGTDAERLELAAVATDRDGRLSEMQLFWLKRWLAIRPEPLAAAPAADGAVDPANPWLPLLYFLQQSANALTLGCIYGLLAIGFTLAYAVLGQINLAFGQTAMLGGIATVIWTALFGMAAGQPLALAATLGLATAATAAGGWATERLAFRPLRDAAPHAPLIAAVGLALVLQEAVRLLQDSGDLWVPPSVAAGFALAEAGGFRLVVSLPQILILALTVLLYLGLAVLLRRTAFGLAHRACAGDRRAAALLGIDVDRTVAASFALGGAYAGVAAFVVVQYYGVANFFMGLVLGFKALAAAIVGGIGSVPGAMLGGMVVAALEIYWSAYLDIAYKDIAVFGLLTLALIFRPGGLLGRAVP